MRRGGRDAACNNKDLCSANCPSSRLFHGTGTLRGALITEIIAVNQGQKLKSRATLPVLAEGQRAMLAGPCTQPYPYGTLRAFSGTKLHFGLY